MKNILFVATCFLFLKASAQDTKAKFDDKATLGTPTPILGLNGQATVNDIDGNTYQTIPIGTQVWMVENLKATRYRNGDTIPKVSVDTWNHLTTGAYCNYDDSTNNGRIYGHLYNWYAVNDSRNICPVGWHVATMAEWTTLVNYLGGSNLAGGKLKEVGDWKWARPNTGASNRSGFTALPGGYFAIIFGDKGFGGYWWTSTQSSSIEAYDWVMEYSSTLTSWNSQYKNCGFSVRCIKN